MAEAALSLPSSGLSTFLESAMVQACCVFLGPLSLARCHAGLHGLRLAWFS